MRHGNDACGTPCQSGLVLGHSPQPTLSPALKLLDTFPIQALTHHLIDWPSTIDSTGNVNDCLSSIDMTSLPQACSPENFVKHCSTDCEKASRNTYVNGYEKLSMLDRKAKKKKKRVELFNRSSQARHITHRRRNPSNGGRSEIEHWP